jgi:hypothetical protein
MRYWGNGLRALACILAVFFVPVWAGTNSQITQYGITWTFDTSCECGQFCNGDYWVVGPVNIIGISPASTLNGGLRINGSMLNPDPTINAQGFDERMSYNSYSAGLNVAAGVSAVNPLTINPVSSLVSVISYDPPQQQNWGAQVLRTAAILTVVAGPPAAGNFRPPFCGSTKSVQFDENQLDYSLLKKLAPVTLTPSLADVEKYFERPWIDFKGSASGRFQHPRENMPDYGREMSGQIGTAALMLHLDFTDQQKRNLLVRFVQYGIDLYGVIKAGGRQVWYQDGGQGGGRKWPVLFAGLMLNNKEMKEVGIPELTNATENTAVIFGEDNTTFYVDQWILSQASAISAIGGEPWIAADLGLPAYAKWRWPIKWFTSQADGRTTRDWGASYQLCCHATAFTGFTLAAHFMNAKSIWNHDAFFDYMDRYISVEGYAADFFGFMWKTYRNDYGCVWKRDNPSSTYSNGSLYCGGCKYNCTRLDDRSQNSAFRIQKGILTPLVNKNQTVSINDIGPGTGAIADITGNKIMSQETKAGRLSFILSDLRNGVYFLQLKTAQAEEVFPFVISR